MKIIINAPTTDMAVSIAHHLNYLLDESQESGTCSATFAPMLTRVVQAEVHKTKTGYSITAWDAGSYADFIQEESQRN